MSSGGILERARAGIIHDFGRRLQDHVDGLGLARPSWLLSVGIGLGATALAKLLRLPFEPFLQGTAPLMPFLPVTLLTGYASGARAGFVSLSLGFALVLVGFDSRPQLRTGVEAAAALVAFVIIGTIGLLLAVAARSSRIRLAASEQEKADGEARYKLLSQEFQHRLSNLVTVASSLAAMSARRGGSAQDMLARLQPRLAAYGRAQGLVRQATSGSVSLAELANAALQPFIQADEPHILIEGGEPVILREATATALTLALHELATNAVKYGALKTDGIVRVFWTRDIASTVRLIWVESGGPRVKTPTSTGFGSILVRDAFSRIAGSSSCLSYREGGVHCEFRLLCEPDQAPRPSGTTLDRDAPPLPMRTTHE